MSGYVISIKLFRPNKIRYLIAGISKRYFRLVPPILGSMLLAYLLMKFNLMYNVELCHSLGTINSLHHYYFDFNPTLLETIISGLGDIFNGRFFRYNGPLWSMRPEFLGSFFCFFLIIFQRLQYYRYLVYGVAIYICMLFELEWLISFILGFLICDIDHSENKLTNIMKWVETRVFSNPWITVPLICMLMILGTERQEWLTTWPIYPDVVISALFVTVISRSKPMQNFFNGRILVWLGKISFSLYVLHWPILCSLGSYLYLASNLPRKLNILTSGSITVAVIILVSIVYANWVDKGSVKLSNSIGNFVANNFIKEV